MIRRQRPPLRLDEEPDGGFSRHGVIKVLLHPGRDAGDATLRSMGYGYIDVHGKVVEEIIA